MLDFRGENELTKIYTPCDKECQGGEEIEELRWRRGRGEEGERALDAPIQVELSLEKVETLRLDSSPYLYYLHAHVGVCGILICESEREKKSYE